MTFLSEIRTVSTPRPKLPPAPKRAMPSAASLETTLAAMKADAKAWKARKAAAWGERLCVHPERVSKASRILWTPDLEAQIADEIMAALGTHGPMTMTELAPYIRTRCTHHKLRSMLTQMKKAGRVVNKQTSNKIHEWGRCE